MTRHLSICLRNCNPKPLPSWAHTVQITVWGSGICGLASSWPAHFHFMPSAIVQRLLKPGRALPACRWWALQDCLVVRVGAGQRDAAPSLKWRTSFVPELIKGPKINRMTPALHPYPHTAFDTLELIWTRFPMPCGGRYESPFWVYIYTSHRHPALVPTSSSI